MARAAQGARAAHGEDDVRGLPRHRAAGDGAHPDRRQRAAGDRVDADAAQAGGASDQAAAYAADLVSLYTTAIAYEESLYRTLHKDPDHEQREVQRITERLASLDPARFPTMAALGPAMTRGDGDERFELGLDVIINGLLATPTEGG
jgi:hypothetical protein